MRHPAKRALIALVGILTAGSSAATADDLLDLGTRDLARMKTVSGITLAFDPGKIAMLYALPRSAGSSSRGSAPIPCAQNCITGSSIFAERYGALGLTFSNAE